MKACFAQTDEKICDLAGGLYDRCSCCNRWDYHVLR